MDESPETRPPGPLDLAAILQQLAGIATGGEALEVAIAYRGWRVRLTVEQPGPIPSGQDPDPLAADDPSPQPRDPSPEPSPQPRGPWASGPEPKVISDYRVVYWPGLGQFRLTESQARVVRRLWEARQAGVEQVAQTLLLRAAGSDGTRLRDLFSRSDAWNRLIVQGLTPGSYRLAPLPGEEEPDAQPENGSEPDA